MNFSPVKVAFIYKYIVNFVLTNGKYTYYMLKKYTVIVKTL